MAVTYYERLKFWKRSIGIFFLLFVSREIHNKNQQKKKKMAAADDLSLEYCAHFYSCGEIAEGLRAFQENFGTSSSEVFRISESCFNFRTVFWTSEPQLSSTIILYSISNIYISISRRIEFARADRKMLFPMLRFNFFQYVTSMIRKIRNVSSRSLFRTEKNT